MSTGLSTTAQSSQIAAMITRVRTSTREREAGGLSDRAGRRRNGRPAQGKAEQHPHHDHGGQNHAIEHVVPVAQGNQHQEEGGE